MCEDRLRVVVKPQLEPSLARKFTGRTVGACLEESDELGKCREIMELLDLEAVRDREVQALSGGELQRFAIARCLNVAADVYLFDEPSSFLDVKQRVAAAQAIRSLVDGVDAAARADSVRAADEARRRAGATYVVVVEHDLTVLDNVSDAVCCLYGGPGAYGVVTKRQAAAAGINQFLAGYIAAENMRFRAEALSFQVSVERDDDGARGVEAVHAPQTHRYPAMSRTLTGENSSFTLDVEAGSYDTAISTHVLCSVDDVRAVLRQVGRALRPDCSWRARATTSLPAPVSPAISSRRQSGRVVCPSGKPRRHMVPVLSFSPTRDGRFRIRITACWAPCSIRKMVRGPMRSKGHVLLRAA